MKKMLVWIFAGLLLGLIIHLSIILLLPRFTPTSVWGILSKIAPIGEIITLERPKAGQENFLNLDPELNYAACRYDLSLGPGILSGDLPKDFWSVGVFDKNGVAIYSTTGKLNEGKSLDLGIFNPSQTRLLVEQQLQMQEDLIVVKAPHNQVFVIVRLAPPYPEMWSSYRNILTKLQCGHISVGNNINVTPEN